MRRLCTGTAIVVVRSQVATARYDADRRRGRDGSVPTEDRPDVSPNPDFECTRTLVLSYHELVTKNSDFRAIVKPSESWKLE